ncbi:AMP-dependent synthetase [Bacillus sp. HMF5848]|uniref:AMP-binding protein n=1 Tax=Bacillus sp. HMF5848 TaxID=2495421 RepID=UPI000F7AA871|nr:AMP-binding protein [Bacillus sp. HMF5848]RSK26261.1 AMP-dependent synthetase [Bacillus sp. HMF5848]
MPVKNAWIPSDEYKKNTRLYNWMKKLGYEDYDSFYKKSIEDVAWLWEQAEKELEINWNSRYTDTLNLENGLPYPKWFSEGTLNIYDSCVTKWLHHQHPAIIWEGDDGTKTTLSFPELHRQATKLAIGLRLLGVKKGNVIGLYMPMIPETVIALLAAAKIGAIICPAFSGYGADAVATRMNAAKAKILITADGFKRRGKQIHLKQQADLAVQQTPSVEKTLVVTRLQSEIAWKETDVHWDTLMNSETTLPNEIMGTDETLMILFTSGTTGKPKGARHTHAGFPIKAAFDAAMGMDVRQGDCLFWYTDMGWMMGPFLVFGGLINGATILLFEGTPDYPAPDRLWQIVDTHHVTHLGISPTLIRSLMKHGEEWVNKHHLSSLRVIGSTGEPWNPEPWWWTFETVGKKKVPIFNYSGGTEISGGILGNVLVKPIKEVSFNAALPGMAVDVYDSSGISVKNEVGELVLKKPWVGMTSGFWQENERYEKTYWSRWKNTWVHGDWVSQDDDQFYTITGRSDDTLNIAGKRLGPTEIESILVDHTHVVEAATIGIPDKTKGEVAVCFVVLLSGDTAESIKQQLFDLVQTKLGKAMKPAEIFFVSDLPKTRNSKVMRRMIKAAYLQVDPGDTSALENPESLEEIRNLVHSKQ